MILAIAHLGQRAEHVFGALRNLGFSERESRSAVRRVLETAETRCPKTLLRAALVLLTAQFA
nr:MAG: hypothetical protein DIU78_02135 [Pseudomonadota bacterium]